MYPGAAPKEAALRFSVAAVAGLPFSEAAVVRLAGLQPPGVPGEKAVLPFNAVAAVAAEVQPGAVADQVAEAQPGLPEAAAGHPGDNIF